MKPTISIKIHVSKKLFFATFFPSSVTAASKSLSSPSGDWGFTFSLLEPYTHTQTLRTDKPARRPRVKN